MKIELNYQNKVLCLPGAVLQKVENANEQDLRVLLMLAGHPEFQEHFDAAKLGVALEIPEREVENAISFWRGAGILKTSKSSKPKEEKEKEDKTPAPVTMQTGLPSYTGKQIEEIMAERKRLGQLLEECQKILDRVFNVTESNMVIALCDSMHLEDDYILLLCSYCTGKSEKGVTMKYVYNTAYRLYEQNILTMQGLEDYIAKEERERDFENYIRRLFGIGGRKLTAKEKKFIENWRAFEFPNEVISYGYELSVDSTGELSYAHLNKILESWKKAGVRDLESAQKNAEEHREEMKKLYDGQKPVQGLKKSQRPEEFSSFDAEEFFEKAKQKSEGALKNKN